MPYDQADERGVVCVWREGGGLVMMREHLLPGQVGGGGGGLGVMRGSLTTRPGG